MRSLVRIRRRKVGIDRAFAEEVVPAIWGLDPSACSGSQLQAYLDHYKDVSGFLLDNFIIVKHASIVSLVLAVRLSAHKNVKGLLAAIESAQPPCLRLGHQIESVRTALAFACKLWLFLELDISDDTSYLRDLISVKVSLLKQGRNVYCDQLSKDFSQKTLDRKAGIGIIWTSDLSQHLEIVGPSTIRVFRHAGALSAYDTQGAG